MKFLILVYKKHFRYFAILITKSILLIQKRLQPAIKTVKKSIPTKQINAIGAIDLED